MTGTDLLLSGISKIGIGLVILWLLIDFRVSCNLWIKLLGQLEEGKGEPSYVRGIMSQARFSTIGNMAAIVILICIGCFSL